MEEVVEKTEKIIRIQPSPKIESEDSLVDFFNILLEWNIEDEKGEKI